MPRVSVIIPAFNAGATMAATIGSVVAQTFQDWEVVVGDDASTDDTAQLARAIDPRVIAVTAERNGGPAAARNLAIEHASGELLAFLDADDLWMPDFLERQVANLDAAVEAGRRVGIVACDAEVIGADGSPRGGYLELGGYLDAGGQVGRVDLRRLLEVNPIFVSAVVPRAVLDDVGVFSTETWGSEDHDLWIRIAERGYEVVVDPRRLARYRESEGSVSSSLIGMARTSQVTYRRALERGNLDGSQRRLARRMLRFYTAIEVVETVMARGRPRLAELPGLARAAVTLAGYGLRHVRRLPVWLRDLVRGGRAPWRTERAG
ncbi:MAG TPA: glycosyltransferase family A protein [Solirubrobacteraceae bacterium]|nr:glycosyltransferase family A protein [Solirubrobacteraceae bacterium]